MKPKDWSIAETFPQEIAQRGMDDVESLPYYPYRDDGLLLWEATEAYVRQLLEDINHARMDEHVDLDGYQGRSDHHWKHHDSPE